MVAATAPELGRVSSDGGVLAVTARALERSSDWEAVAAFRGTVVVFMGERRWHDLTCRLVAAGRRPDEPAAMAQHAMNGERRAVPAGRGREKGAWHRFCGP